MAPEIKPLVKPIEEVDASLIIVFFRSDVDTVAKFKKWGKVPLK